MGKGSRDLRSAISVIEVSSLPIGRGSQAAVTPYKNISPRSILSPTTSGEEYGAKTRSKALRIASSRSSLRTSWVSVARASSQPAQHAARRSVGSAKERATV